MKKTIKFLAGAAVAALTVVSCSRELENINDKEQAPNENAITIRVHASADEIKSDAPEVKTYLGTYQSQENTVLWGTGEYMKLALASGDEPTNENTVFGDSSDDSADAWIGSNEADFAFSITPSDANASSFTLMGVYPKSAVSTSKNTNPLAYKVNLPATQTSALNATTSAYCYDPKAYIMVAQPETVTTGLPTDWVASFRRGTALNKLTLKSLPAAVQAAGVKRVEISADVKDSEKNTYLAGSRYVNLATGVSGEIYNGGTRTQSINVKLSPVVSGNANVDVWFTSWGVELVAGDVLTVKVFAGDKVYTRALELTGTQKISLKEGFLNTLGFGMGGNDVVESDNTELEEGTYLVLANNSGTYYALKAEAEGTRMNYESYTGSTSAYAGSNSSIIWTISKSEGSYIFANGSNYLGWTSGNTAAMNEPGESWTTTHYLLDATYDSTNSCYSVTVHSESGRILAKNTGTYGFAFYTGSGYNQIIFVPATLDNRTEVSLTFDNDQVSLTPAEAAQYLGEDLTISPNVAAVSEHLTWDYEDNDGIIDEFDNGALTLTGDEGTATVTVSFGGDENYLPASASYTITVAAASVAEPEWVETAIGDLTTSDVFVIVGSTGPYAMSNDNGTGSAPATVSVTVSGTKLTGTIADNIKWNISGNATDGYTFYPNGDSDAWLYCTATNNGVRVGTNSNKLFTLDANGYLVNSATSRYVSIYNNQDWRCYNNTNNNPQVVKFYKYVDVPDTRDSAPISWSAETGTATMSESGISSTLPSLTNTSSLAVSYASSDEAVATIANDGTVTILSGGPTTISATYDGSAANAPYKTTTVSYTLTVTDNRTACATPSFSPAAGEVESGDEITISSATTGATIYYTTGNSEFSAGDWTEYTAPVEVTSACTIKAIAVKANYLNSAVASATYTIAASASTIAQVLAGGEGTYEVPDVLVYAVKGSALIIGDATGKMYAYKSSHGLSVGDVRTVSGSTTVYNDVYEFNAPTFSGSGTASVNHGTAVELDSQASALQSAFANPSTAVYVHAIGSQSSRNITTTGGTALYLSAAESATNGKTVEIYGYVYAYSTSHSNFDILVTSIEEYVDVNTPTVSVDPTSLNWTASEYGSANAKTIEVTLNGAASAGDYNISGSNSAWTVSKNGNTITVYPNAENSSTTDAKSITLTIAHADDPSVYQEVTCTQAKASGGDTPTPTTTTYTFTTKSWDDATHSWTSGKDGNQLTSGRGVQITTGASGANATLNSSLNGISEVVVTYSTNASKGAGSISIKIGSNTAHTQSVSTSGGTTDRTLTYTINPSESGAVNLAVTCSTNSIYVKSVAITHN